MLSFFVTEVPFLIIFRPMGIRRKIQRRSKFIGETDRTVLHEAIKIVPPSFVCGIPAQPFPAGRMVISESVIQEVRFTVLVFGREAERIGPARRAGDAKDFTEGAVFILAR